MGERTIDIEIKINCDNSAFTGMPEYETARILRDLAQKLEQRGMEDIPCMDLNGNRVGDLVVTDQIDPEDDP
jgi:hypothetical protein